MTDPLPTVEDAVRNATRLLYAGEEELDLAKMEQIRSLADAWIALGALVGEHAL